jgi:hypothetical protein
MTEIETLTDEERADLQTLKTRDGEGAWLDTGARALRILNAQAERIAELRAALDRSTDDHGDVCKELHATKAKLRALEAKETTRNAGRLAELASGTVNRVEYDRMVEQRDTIRKERKDAQDRASTLRGILGDVLYELVKLREHPEERWRLDEAIATADLDGHKYNCDSPDYVGEPELQPHCSACEDYPTLGLLRCTICGRTGDAEG